MMTLYGSGTPTRATLYRVLLAGPGAVAATLLVVLGMALWIPPGPAGIDQITIPLVVLPLVWAALFFHACLDRSLKRAALVVLALAAANGVALGWHVARPPAASAEVAP